MITIKGKAYAYRDDEVINFAEGLVGFPDMRRAVVVPMDEYEPFCWLVSVEDERNAFIVVDANEIFADYHPWASGMERPGVKTLAMVKISSDWQKTTFNLRAPIVIDSASRHGSQFILTDSRYSLAEPVPQS
jgi:flagellar assembly factor FliW